MSLACYDNFIGIRSEIGAETPRSSLYIEDIPGVDLQRMANIATDSTGLELIKKAIRNACDEACEEAMNYKSDEGKSPLMLTNPIGATYSQSKFTDNLLDTYAGDRGIRFELRRPDFYQYSSMVVKRIYLLAGQDASAVVVSIIDGSQTTALDPVDLVADELYTIDLLNYKAKNRNFQILTDHSAVRFYQAYTPSNTGCSSCGGNKRYEDGYISQMFVSGGYGISAVVALECDTDRIKCGILAYLRYAIHYKAVMNLALEGQFTNRLNFYAASMDFEQFYNYLEAQYRERMNRISPSIRRLLMPQDRNCFKCAGMTMATINY